MPVPVRVENLLDYSESNYSFEPYDTVLDLQKAIAGAVGVKSERSIHLYVGTEVLYMGMPIENLIRKCQETYENLDKNEVFLYLHIGDKPVDFEERKFEAYRSRLRLKTVANESISIVHLVFKHTNNCYSIPINRDNPKIEDLLSKAIKSIAPSYITGISASTAILYAKDAIKGQPLDDEALCDLVKAKKRPTIEYYTKNMPITILLKFQSCIFTIRKDELQIEDHKTLLELKETIKKLMQNLSNKAIIRKASEPSELLIVKINGVKYDHSAMSKFKKKEGYHPNMAWLRFFELRDNSTITVYL